MTDAVGQVARQGQLPRFAELSIRREPDDPGIGGATEALATKDRPNIEILMGKPSQRRWGTTPRGRHPSPSHRADRREPRRGPRAKR
ncbi:MAG: hypothetical protein EA397_02715 [Deltaproteobacteria bacterium]|nr:MAG: hypothetical protein EA397_02715 [Deltaproteobacteria bacterium]